MPSVLRVVSFTGNLLEPVTSQGKGRKVPVVGTGAFAEAPFIKSNLDSLSHPVAIFKNRIYGFGFSDTVFSRYFMHSLATACKSAELR